VAARREVSELAGIARDAGLDPDEKIVRLAEVLWPQEGHGVGGAAEFFVAEEDLEAARATGDYTGLVPDAAAEKERMVRHALDERPDKRDAAVRPLRSASEETIDAAIAAYLEEPKDRGNFALAYEAGLFFPERLRARGKRIADDPRLSKVVLPGAGDDVVARLEDAYRRSQDEEAVRDLAMVRTDTAREALIELQADAPEGDRETLELCLEACGVFPDTREASVYFKSSRGFVVEREASPHHMGAGYEGPRPQCPMCSTPTTRVLSLRGAELPFELEGDPSFFWFSCECEALSYLYVHATDSGLEGLMVEMTEDAPDAPIVPDAPSLLLEPHPNQCGFGESAPWGFGNHQVGGYTPWIELDRHPACPLCSQSMRFLAAVDSGATPFGRAGFDGMLYGFWCEADRVACTMQQQDELSF
jgi:hypothetical protein